MTIACATDAGYFQHCAAMLASLLESNPGADVQVLCDEDVSAQDRELLTRWGTDRGGRIVCSVPKVNLPPRMPGLPSLTRAAWLRLFLPNLFPALARILYLDIDLIVRESLQPLWSLDLQGHWLGAVSDVRVNYADRTHEGRLQLPPGSVYFNSGVMLIDLDAFRRERIGERSLQYAAQHPSMVRHADQDPLNALLQGRRLPIPLRWNAQSPIFENETAATQPFAEAEMREAVAHPAIVHFSGPWKPWHYRSRHPLRQLYAQYRALTPWSEWTLDGQTLKHRILRLMPESMARTLTSWYWTVPNWLAERRKLQGQT